MANWNGATFYVRPSAEGRTTAKHMKAFVPVGFPAEMPSLLPIVKNNNAFWVPIALAGEDYGSSAGGRRAFIVSLPEAIRGETNSAMSASDHKYLRIWVSNK